MKKKDRIHVLCLLCVQSMISENSDRIRVLCLLYVQSMISENNDRIHVLCLLYVLREALLFFFCTGSSWPTLVKLWRLVNTLMSIHFLFQFPVFREVSLLRSY